LLIVPKKETLYGHGQDGGVCVQKTQLENLPNFLDSSALWYRPSQHEQLNIYCTNTVHTGICTLFYSVDGHLQYLRYVVSTQKYGFSAWLPKASQINKVNTASFYRDTKIEEEQTPYYLSTTVHVSIKAPNK
jgi:hypothetical protein